MRPDWNTIRDMTLIHYIHYYTTYRKFNGYQRLSILLCCVGINSIKYRYREESINEKNCTFGINFKVPSKTYIFN